MAKDFIVRIGNDYAGRLIESMGFVHTHFESATRFEEGEAKAVARWQQQFCEEKVIFAHERSDAATRPIKPPANAKMFVVMTGTEFVSEVKNKRCLTDISLIKAKRFSFDGAKTLAARLRSSTPDTLSFVARECRPFKALSKNPFKAKSKQPKSK